MDHRTTKAAPGGAALQMRRRIQCNQCQQIRPVITSSVNTGRAMMVNDGALEHPHVDRVSNPSKEVFLDQYGFPGKPVVILDVMKNWKAMTRWTTHFFITK